ncbi:serine hydrolase FSH [Rostrohypoxylon terebratum]|nr:serine hydrolase FSH [Rostrohypoxylon terebratum]
MRFLCLHGMGTNSQIFRSQTERIRDLLGPEHENVFVNGFVPSEPLPGFRLQSDAPCWSYWTEDVNKWDVVSQGLQTLVEFIRAKGPFGGVIGFSQGASTAAAIILNQNFLLGDAGLFKCAIFFCGSVPPDIVEAERGRLQWLNPDEDGVVLQLPTAHIWSDPDDMFPGQGPRLSRLCDERLKEQVIHNLGHDVPGASSDEFLREALTDIRRTLDRAQDL